MRLRWKLIRRRLSHSVPRMTVRRHLPWPLRWIALALVFGFFGGLGLYIFDAGQQAAGLGQARFTGLTSGKERLQQLQQELDRVRHERDQAQNIANTADSLLKAEKTAQEKLIEQLKTLETENLELKADLGFFERLLPGQAEAGGADFSIRGLLVEPSADLQKMHYQALFMLPGRNSPEFVGQYEVVMSGVLKDKPWSQSLSGGAKSVSFKHYQRVEGFLEMPQGVTVKQVQMKVVDKGGRERALELVKLSR